MKTLKSIAFTVALALGTFGAVTYTSCNSDDCKDVVCNNGGTCIDGNCSCPTGFEGSDCGTLARAKFLGTYTGSESCTLGTDNYSVKVTEHSDKAKMNIENLYNENFVANANPDGNGFTIPSQSVGSSTTVSGNGTISGNNISITYTINNGATSNTCTYTGTK